MYIVLFHKMFLGQFLRLQHNCSTPDDFIINKTEEMPATLDMSEKKKSREKKANTLCHGFLSMSCKNPKHSYESLVEEILTKHATRTCTSTLFQEA